MSVVREPRPWSPPVDGGGGGECVCAFVVHPASESPCLGHVGWGRVDFHLSPVCGGRRSEVRGHGEGVVDRDRSRLRVW